MLLLPALAVLWFSVSIPLRAQGGDTVPGRLAMVTLACEGRSDLSSVHYLAEAANAGRLPYYARPTADRRGIVSTFGPGPGWLGSAFFADVAPGARVDDAVLRARARWAASSALALSVFLLGAGLLAVAPLGASLAVATALGLSFAGAATLGQGLWQQTSSLPWLVGALAAGLWSERRPWLVPAAVGAAAMAAWLRPAELPLAAALALFAWLRCPASRRSLALVTASLLVLVAVSMMLMTYNLWYLDTPWPRTQWDANSDMTDSVLVFAPGHVLVALVGLLVSPARGWLWFAPAAAFGLAWSLSPGRRRAPGLQALWLGVGMQVLLCAMFFKWWGGLTFGPRLLALSTWVAAVMPWLSGLAETRNAKRGFALALALSAAVGITGALHYDPRRWEIPKDPDHHPERLFDWRDSPWQTMWAGPLPGPALGDAPGGPFVYCAPRGLRAP